MNAMANEEPEASGMTRSLLWTDETAARIRSASGSTTPPDHSRRKDTRKSFGGAANSGSLSRPQFSRDELGERRRFRERDVALRVGRQIRQRGLLLKQTAFSVGDLDDGGRRVGRPCDLQIRQAREHAERHEQDRHFVAALEEQADGVRQLPHVVVNGQLRDAHDIRAIFEIQHHLNG